MNIQTESIKKFQFEKVINTEKQDRQTVIDGQKDIQTNRHMDRKTYR